MDSCARPRRHTNQCRVPPGSRRIPVRESLSRRRVEQLVRMPNMGAARELRNPSLKGLRFWPLTGFDEFLIFYLVKGDTVRVIRILARQARR